MGEVAPNTLPSCLPLSLSVPRHQSLSATWHVAGSYGWQGKDTLNIELHWVDWFTSASLEILFPKQDPPLISITPHNTGNKVQIIAK